MTDLEQRYSSVEEIYDLVSSLIIISVTAWRECVDTSSMFIPLMFPEMFRGAAVGKPISIHEAKEFGLGRSTKDISYVVMLGC